jgi:hypothetical protein
MLKIGSTARGKALNLEFTPGDCSRFEAHARVGRFLPTLSLSHSKGRGHQNRSSKIYWRSRMAISLLRMWNLLTNNPTRPSGVARKPLIKLKLHPCQPHLVRRLHFHPGVKPLAGGHVDNRKIHTKIGNRLLGHQVAAWNAASLWVSGPVSS